MAFNQTGANNTAVGYNSLFRNTTGFQNTATGTNALCSNTFGCYNTAVGVGALQANQIGLGNAAFGRFALVYNTTGGANAALGSGSLRNNNGSYNTAVGVNAFCSLTTGSLNVGVGFQVTPSSNTISNEVNIANGVVVARFQGAAGSWSFVSDERDKSDIVALPLGLEFVKALEPRKFKWDIRNTEVDKGKEAAGFIAQEVLAVTEQFEAPYTGLVSTNDPNQYTFAQSNLIPILVNAIKELAADFEEYKRTHP
jgi:hypothetical protein